MQADLSSDDDEDASGRGGSCGSNKRVMANRQSAQRSRMRKLQFISDLEANVQSLENDIKSMNPMHSALRQKHAGAPLATHNSKFLPVSLHACLLKPHLLREVSCKAFMV